MLAVAELIARMKDGEYADRSRAAEALAEIGPAAAEAIPDMVALLRSFDDDEDDDAEFIANFAAWVLSRIGPAAVPRLIQLLMDADAPWKPGRLLADPSRLSAEGRKALEHVKLEIACFVRRQAAWALGEIGAGARAALNPLRHMLEDPNPVARASAAEAIEKIGAAAGD